MLSNFFFICLQTIVHTALMTFSIRFANERDVKTIFEFIKLLAIYEKAPGQVTITKEDLLQDGFGKSPLFNCLIAESVDGTAVGMALYYKRYSTWKGKSIHLEDLIVRKENRGLGIGFELLKEVAKIAMFWGAERFEWEVLSWNTPAINFYKNLGATLDPEWILCKMYSKDIKKLLSKNEDL